MRIVKTKQTAAAAALWKINSWHWSIKICRVVLQIHFPESPLQIFSSLLLLDTFYWLYIFNWPTLRPGAKCWLFYTISEVFMEEHERRTSAALMSECMFQIVAASVATFELSVWKTLRFLCHVNWETQQSSWNASQGFLWFFPLLPLPRNRNPAPFLISFSLACRQHCLLTWFKRP